MVVKKYTRTDDEQATPITREEVEAAARVAIESKRAIYSKLLEIPLDNEDR